LGTGKTLTHQLLLKPVLKKKKFKDLKLGFYIKGSLVITDCQLDGVIIR
jgi:hypothetical protein